MQVRSRSINTLHGSTLVSVNTLDASTAFGAHEDAEKPEALLGVLLRLEARIRRDGGSDSATAAFLGFCCCDSGLDLICKG